MVVPGIMNLGSCFFMSKYGSRQSGECILGASPAVLHHHVSVPTGISCGHTEGPLCGRITPKPDAGPVSCGVSCRSPLILLFSFCAASCCVVDAEDLFLPITKAVSRTLFISCCCPPSLLMCLSYEGPCHLCLSPHPQKRHTFTPWNYLQGANGGRYSATCALLHASMGACCTACDACSLKLPRFDE